MCEAHKTCKRPSTLHVQCVLLTWKMLNSSDCTRTNLNITIRKLIINIYHLPFGNLMCIPLWLLLFSTHNFVGWFFTCKLSTEDDVSRNVTGNSTKRKYQWKSYTIKINVDSTFTSVDLLLLKTFECPLESQTLEEWIENGSLLG